jgi:hypothetical protein
MLSYREATELTECIRIMGGESRDYCRQAVLGEVPVTPSIEITRVGGVDQTFLWNEAITLTGRVINAPVNSVPATSFDWTVQGLSTNAGNGNPHTAANQSQFTFTPNPSNRPRTGSRRPNDPIRYLVMARAANATGSFWLTQDEPDIIRQEYLDLGPVVPPDRAQIQAPAIAGYNTGNYSLIVDNGLDTARTDTETEFQALFPAGGAPAPAIGVSSGYRNPRRNVAAGSNFPVGSRHVWGRALDLVVNGANAVIWGRLRQAGANAGNSSICEDGPTQIPCNNPNVDHVHIQW